MERTCLASADGGTDFLMVRLGIFWTIFILFIGCGSPDETLPYPLTITQEGLGPLHPTTPFEEVPTAMIGFESQKLSLISPDQTEVIYAISKGSHTVAHVFSDTSGKKIDAIHVLSVHVQDVHGQKIGSALEASIPCGNGRCSDPSSPSISYEIDPKTRIIRQINYQRL